MNIFVTGIGTGVGKTIVSAILVEALKADYCLPVISVLKKVHPLPLLLTAIFVPVERVRFSNTSGGALDEINPPARSTSSLRLV